MTNNSTPAVPENATPSSTINPTPETLAQVVTADPDQAQDQPRQKPTSGACGL